jgi:hypothetical protein
MMRRKIVRTDEEINEVLNKAAESMDSGTRWRGMTYEEGVQNALLWLFGELPDNPMPDE